MPRGDPRSPEIRKKKTCIWPNPRIHDGPTIHPPTHIYLSFHWKPYLPLAFSFSRSYRRPSLGREDKGGADARLLLPPLEVCSLLGLSAAPAAVRVRRPPCSPASSQFPVLLDVLVDTPPPVHPPSLLADASTNHSPRGTSLETGEDFAPKVLMGPGRGRGFGERGGDPSWSNHFHK